MCDVVPVVKGFSVTAGQNEGWGIGGRDYSPYTHTARLFIGLYAE